MSSTTPRLTRRQISAMTEQFHDDFRYYGLPWDRYRLVDAGLSEGGVTAWLTWQHGVSGAQVEAVDVYFNDETSEILQYQFRLGK